MAADHRCGHRFLRCSFLQQLWTSATFHQGSTLPRGNRPTNDKDARMPISLQRPCGFFAALSVSLLASTATLAEHHEGTDHEAVLAVVTALFDGMRGRDEAKLRSVFGEEARLGTQGVDGFIERVVTGERFLDEVTFDETVLIDGDLAMAWTPYNLFVDDVFHHCGVDLFVMKLSDEGWRITQLDDTRRTEGCDPERRD